MLTVRTSFPSVKTLALRHTLSSSPVQGCEKVLTMERKEKNFQVLSQLPLLLLLLSPNEDSFARSFFLSPSLFLFSLLFSPFLFLFFFFPCRVSEHWSFFFSPGIAFPVHGSVTECSHRPAQWISVQIISRSVLPGVLLRGGFGESMQVFPNWVLKNADFHFTF